MSNLTRHGKKKLVGIILYQNEGQKTMTPSLLWFKIFLLWVLLSSQPMVRKIRKTCSKIIPRSEEKT